VPLVFGLFGRFRPPPALAARCGIVVRRRIHFPGRPFARSRSGERCQGFSPLQPRCRFFVQHDSAIAGSAVANSLRPSAGGANEEAAPRARDCRPAARLDSLLAVEPGSQSPGPASLASVFSAHESSGPHAPSTNSILGPDHESNLFGRLITEGPAPALRPLPARSTLLRRTMTTCPVPGDWPSPPLDSAPRSASRPTLGHSAKMPRIRFYNRRFAPRAPMSKHHLWRLRPSAVGNPPTFDFQIACWSAAALGVRDSSGDAGPPCGHPASNSFALDGAMPASGRSAATLVRLARGGVKHRSFVGLR
jgi:hypothetical protein